MDMNFSESIYEFYPVDDKVGVIDIGSNSVRLVVYDGVKRVPLPIYNEKAFCRLGLGIAKGDSLNAAAVKMAKQAIAQFMTTIKLMRVAKLHILATAAVREAKNGADFIRDIEQQHGVKIEILSGEQEAQYAAYGILSTHYKPRGIVGDLGGGSLELVSLHDDIGYCASLPLGALRMQEMSQSGDCAIVDLVRSKLQTLSWLQNNKQYKNFYAIGGSFRALAKLHMQQSGYPLDLLDNYELSSAEILNFLQQIATLPSERVNELAVSSKRQAQMPVAAIILQEIIKTICAEKVIFSTSGIREGLLFSFLSPYTQKEDPLLAVCAELAAEYGNRSSYYIDLYNWMEPLFSGETALQSRLRVAACILHDLARIIYRPNRAKWVYFMIMHSSLVGLSHRQRIALATALYHRYRPQWREDWSSYQLLSDKWRNWAAVVGAAMRLGHYLSGGVAGNLAHSAIEVTKSTVNLCMSAEAHNLRGDACDKRLAALKNAYTAYIASK